jgi:hypothetical protein
MRVVMVKGISQYGGTRLFVEHAATAFRARGWDVELVDIPHDVAPLLRRAARLATDLVFTINYLGEFRDPTGRSVAEIFRAPHVLWHTDYVLAREARVVGTPRMTALLTVDPTQVDAVEAILGADRFVCLGFFPHPAVGEPAPDDADVEAFVRNRPIPLLWSGSFQKPRERPWAQAPQAARDIFEAALELVLASEWTPPHEALDTVLRATGMDMSDPDLMGARMAAKAIDQEVRLHRRFALLEALSASGQPLYICGAGWEDELHRFPDAVYAGAVEMSRMTELMRRSRVVLNTNGNFGAGSHERPFSALLAGAAVFSDYSRYYACAFAEDEISLFRCMALDTGMEALRALVEQPQRAFAQARKGKAKVLAHHTWAHRLDLILEAAAALQREGFAAPRQAVKVYPAELSPPG